MEPAPPVWSSDSVVRRRGLLLLGVVLALGVLFSTPLERALGVRLFDVWQRFEPRTRISAPAVIVAIDEASLHAYGAWPWPRSLIARLAARIGEHAPAAVGFDVLFAEPDRFSPKGLSAMFADLGEPARTAFDMLPDGDAQLAAVFAGGPFVVARAGAIVDFVAPAGRSAPVRVLGADPLPVLTSFPGLLPGVAAIESSAPAQGLVSFVPEDGMVRRVPLLFNVGGQIMPSLPLAMLHLAAAAGALRIDARAGYPTAVGLGDIVLPVGPDAQVWPWFGRSDRERLVSAKSVIEGRVAADVLAGKLVLVGFDAHALQDLVATPLGERIPGVEVHAQFIENVFDGTLLRRPAFLRPIEILIAGVAGLLLVLVVPRLSAGRAWGFWLLICAAALVASGMAFRTGVLFDAASIAAMVTVVFAGVLGMHLADTERQRRRLDEELVLQRESAMRLEGEFAAAQRVQLGILPLPGALVPDRRYRLAASMVAAKQVGGDLYDFFMLDADRLFFLIGDVSGKGLAASIFMALSKTLCKSLALRGALAPSEVLARANTEIARDNPELLFITAIAGILDLATGDLRWSRAGHDAPYLIPAAGGPVQRLIDDGGPPLCVVDDYPFPDAGVRLHPGDTLILLTDGILEAQNPDGHLYGRSELDAQLARLRDADAPQTIVDRLMGEVVAYAGEADPADDATVLVIRWDGPADVRPESRAATRESPPALGERGGGEGNPARQRFSER